MSYIDNYFGSIEMRVRVTNLPYLRKPALGDYPMSTRLDVKQSVREPRQLNCTILLIRLMSNPSKGKVILPGFPKTNTVRRVWNLSLHSSCSSSLSCPKTLPQPSNTIPLSSKLAREWGFYRRLSNYQKKCKELLARKCAIALKK